MRNIVRRLCVWGLLVICALAFVPDLRAAERLDSEESQNVTTQAARNISVRDTATESKDSNPEEKAKRKRDGNQPQRPDEGAPSVAEDSPDGSEGENSPDMGKDTPNEGAPSVAEDSPGQGAPSESTPSGTGDIPDEGQIPSSPSMQEPAKETEPEAPEKDPNQELNPELNPNSNTETSTAATSTASDAASATDVTTPTVTEPWTEDRQRGTESIVEGAEATTADAESASVGAKAEAARASEARRAEQDELAMRSIRDKQIQAENADQETKAAQRAKAARQAQDMARSNAQAQGSTAQNAGIEAQASSSGPHVSYRTHVQTLGWQSWVRDGSTGGTSGQSRRLEGICIKLTDTPSSGGIQYCTHVQTYGWQGWSSDGAMSGTSGQSKRLEAIQIRLTGDMASKYDVWYRVHAQTFGWMGWAKNGARAGTATFSKRLEAIQIRILPRGSAAPGSTSRPYATRTLRYRTHVQTHGWQGWSFDGAIAGTTGQSKRLEGIHIAFADPLFGGSIQYRTHVQTYGWQGWSSDGAISGTSGQSKRLEAIQIRLTGDMASKYDVWYRVHAQTFGWMGWAQNGQQAGTAGYSKRLEAIQILLVTKGSQQPSTTYGGAVQSTAAAFSSPASNDNPEGQSSPSSTATSRGPKSAGALAVKGAQLVDKDGKPFQLKGISTHGLAWFPDYVNDACFRQLRNDWNANVVRLALYTEEYGGYCSGGDKATLSQLLKRGVRLATQNDLYVIVDWHILSDGNPQTHMAEAKAFFRDISSTFKNNVNVLYEICNEPNGGTSWSDIKGYANQVIPVIRQNDPDAVVIVGTPTWSQEIDKAAESRLTQGNVMYALHFYAATHKDDLRNRMVRAVKGGLPVFVSEFGICDASGNGSIDQTSANSWVTTMNSLHMSWCMWSLCNKAESASAIKSSCVATSGFKASDLSTSGSWLLKALNGTLPAGSDASKDTGNSGSSGSSGSSGGSTQPAKAVTFSSGGLICKATLTNSWSAGNGKTCYQYDLAITNKDAARSSWSVTVPFNKAITYTNGWNGSYTAKGSKLTIRNANYNGSIAKGATLSGMGFQVTAASGLAIKP